MRIRIEFDSTAIWKRLAELAKKFNINHFLLLYFAAHMLQIAFPSDGSMIFDEAHYVPASVQTLQGLPANAEHPPLPKIIGALGIALFGNNWFGWRFPQVLMQIAALYVFYLIGRRFTGEKWALGATMILGLDTIFFIHGGALLIDMPSFLLSFLAFELYFRKRYSWSAASMALAFVAREMSLFMFAALAVYHIASNRHTIKPALKVGLRYMLVLLLVFGTVWWAYDLAYLPYSSTSVTNFVNANIVVQNGTAITTIYTTSQSTSRQIIWNPIQHLLFIYQYHGPAGMVIPENVATYDFAWNWILPNQPFNVPTYFRVDVAVTTGSVTQHYIPIWYRSQPNLVLWYAYIPVFGALVWLAVEGKKEKRTDVAFLLGGLILNYSPWLVMSLLVKRIGFNYYMIWTLPFIAWGLAYACAHISPRWGRLVMLVCVLFSIVSFVWLFPVRPMP